MSSSFSFTSNVSALNNSYDLLALCTEAEQLYLFWAYNAFCHLNTCCLAIALVAFPILIFHYSKYRILLHGNLLLLFANILFVNFIYILSEFVYFVRYQILMLTYKQPCELLSPLWMTCVLFAPLYLQSIAYPALHFCVTIERFRATLLAERYENEGRRLGRWMLLAIWPFCLAYVAFVVWAAIEDPKMAVQSAMVLTTARSAQLTLYVNYAVLVLVVFTASCDWRITVLNNRMRMMSQNHCLYNLSRNFQLNENVQAMRLILPLDVAYAMLFTIYTALIIVLRSYRPILNIVQYATYFGGIGTLMHFYTAVTMLLYIRFIRIVSRSQKRTTMDWKQSMSEQTKLYFKQLDIQWQRQS